MTMIGDDVQVECVVWSAPANDPSSEMVTHCTRAELWAAIETLDKAAIAVAHAAAREELSGYRRKHGYDEASERHVQAKAAVRELLGMEPKS